MPFRQSALDFVEDLIKLVPRSSSDDVTNKKRLLKEFSEEEPGTEEMWIQKPGKYPICSRLPCLLIPFY